MKASSCAAVAPARSAFSRPLSNRGRCSALPIPVRQGGLRADGPAADLGAEIIKVEACQYPDWWRGTDLRPEFIAEQKYEKILWFQLMNRNKKDVTLDLTNPEGAALLKRLVEWVEEEHDAAGLDPSDVARAGTRPVDAEDDMIGAAAGQQFAVLALFLTGKEAGSQCSQNKISEIHSVHVKSSFSRSAVIGPYTPSPENAVNKDHCSEDTPEVTRNTR